MVSRKAELLLWGTRCPQCSLHISGSTGMIQAYPGGRQCDPPSPKGVQLPGGLRKGLLPAQQLC